MFLLLKLLTYQAHNFLVAPVLFYNCKNTWFFYGFEAALETLLVMVWKLACEPMALSLFRGLLVSSEVFEP